MAAMKWKKAMRLYLPGPPPLLSAKRMRRKQWGVQIGGRKKEPLFLNRALVRVHACQSESDDWPGSRCKPALMWKL
jgi:hypothetical protein